MTSKNPAAEFANLKIFARMGDVRTTAKIVEPGLFVNMVGISIIAGTAVLNTSAYMGEASTTAEIVEVLAFVNMDIGK